MFLVRTITTRTLLAGTLIVTVIPTLRPTLALLQQEWNGDVKQLH